MSLSGLGRLQLENGQIEDSITISLEAIKLGTKLPDDLRASKTRHAISTLQHAYAIDPDYTEAVFHRLTDQSISNWLKIVTRTVEPLDYPVLFGRIGHIAATWHFVILPRIEWTGTVARGRADRGGVRRSTDRAGPPRRPVVARAGLPRRAMASGQSAWDRKRVSLALTGLPPPAHPQPGS